MDKRYKHWSIEEKEYVFDVWGDVTISKIAKKLGRTPYAIIRFAEKNSLGGAILNAYCLSTLEVADMVGVNQSTVIDWIKSKKLVAKKIGRTKRSIYRIETYDLTTFLENNLDRWNATKINVDFIDTDSEWFKAKLEVDSKKVNIKNGSLWTTLEERKLIDLVKEGLTNAEISLLLDRTKSSIDRKRCRLKRLGKL